MYGKPLLMETHEIPSNVGKTTGNGDVKYRQMCGRPLLMETCRIQETNVLQHEE